MLKDKLLALHDPKGPERCGVMVRSGDIIELPNIHPKPMEAFAFEVTPLSDENVIATWHTHPTTGPNLSVADYRLFREYPRLGHLIIWSSDVWLFLVKDDILIRYGNSSTWLSERTASGPDTSGSLIGS